MVEKKINKHLGRYLLFSLVTSAFFFLIMYKSQTDTGKSSIIENIMCSVGLGIIFSGYAFFLFNRKFVRGYPSDFTCRLLSRFSEKEGTLHFSQILMRAFIPKRYYFKITNGNFEARNVFSKIKCSGITQVAIKNKKEQIIAVGDPDDLKEVQRHIREFAFDCRIVTWFDQSSKTITDYKCFVTTLKYSIYKCRKASQLSLIVPFIVFHIVDKFDYSEDEIKLIREAGMDVGSLNLYIWGGHELSDNEIATGAIFSDEWVGKKPFWLNKMS